MDAKARALAIMKRKDEIEAEIAELQDVLKTQNVSANERLIDKEGFPRADIDLVVITSTRSSLVKLRNDHKEILKQVEEALHQVHAEAKIEQEKVKEAKRIAGESTPDVDEKQPSQQQQVYKDPFALVNAVAPDSPANQAGLLRGDKIVQFGQVNVTNHNQLKGLNECVVDHEDKPILVKVQREGLEGLQSVILVPSRNWGGRGLLGCHILPI